MWARARIAEDWADARGEFEIFGVPTLRVEGVAPFYLRLERVPRGEHAHELLESIRAFGQRLPQVLEIKVPERARVAAVGRRPPGIPMEAAQRAPSSALPLGSVWRGFRGRSLTKTADGRRAGTRSTAPAGRTGQPARRRAGADPAGGLPT